MAKHDDAFRRRQAIIDDMLDAALRPRQAPRPPGGDALLPDIRDTIDQLLVKARPSRFLTYEDIEDALPKRDITADEVEAILTILAEHDISVEDGEGG